MLSAAAAAAGDWKRWKWWSVRARRTGMRRRKRTTRSQNGLAPSSPCSCLNRCGDLVVADDEDG